MSIFRWRGLGRSAEDHPRPLPPLPAGFAAPPVRVSAPPPPGPWSTWTYQHGIHDGTHDPCGAGPLKTGETK